MGKIKAEVAAHHLARYPTERELLVPFLTNFDVTWASRHKNSNTQFSAYFLSPEQAITEQFGIDTEVLLVVSDFPELQPRAMQAIDQFMREMPALGRVDPTTIFLVSPDPKLNEWISAYASLNPQFRVTVALTTSRLRAVSGDTWFIRSALSEQLFSRDLFNDQLPLKSDTFFFGRTKIAADFATSVKTSQNRGLFGLRKTGKTSLLFKVKRIAEGDGSKVLYFDCKDPAIRSMNWQDFLEDIIKEAYALFGKRPKNAAGHVSRRFKQMISELFGDKRLCIIFDEIEWVSPVATLDPHWRKDFVPFWQTLWTTQSEFRQLSFIVAGVNPTVTEMAEVDGVQNPLFSIIGAKFLTGFDESDVRSMLGKFGKRMGLRFEQDAIAYMFKRYGGHPMLTRMAGSYINSTLSSRAAARPVRIDEASLVAGEDERDKEVMYYCPHVVSELKKFYPKEYEMLEWLVTGNVADFHDASDNGVVVKHLREYGLVNKKVGEVAKIEIPVLARYVLDEIQRRAPRENTLYIVPEARRPRWLYNRLKRIGSDVRRLDKVGQGASRPKLYAESGFPEAERFFASPVVRSRADLEDFLNGVNRCLVEPIDSFGKSIGKRDYFWNDVKAAYPHLWHALLRVKLYRNNIMHLELSAHNTQLLEAMRANDIDGHDWNKIDDEHFFVQQKVLDGLFVGALIETDRLA